ncbi:MAG TPA: hypothetical protein VMZ53_29560 [Kofleriaceae bacterium]|nr:hypothetical protein [Kofleriaceae bacterium]
MLKKSGFLIVTLVLMAFAVEARAEHVDWSSYIDPNPSKPVTSKPVTVVSDDAPKAKSSGKASKRVAKKATSKRKVKARAKSKKSRRK